MLEKILVAVLRCICCNFLQQYREYYCATSKLSFDHFYIIMYKKPKKDIEMEMVTFKVRLLFVKKSNFATQRLRTLNANYKGEK